jgi:hypothetical protein
MTTPIRRVCDDMADLSSLQVVLDLVTDDHHLVLEIEPTHSGPEFDVRSIISHFAPSLPDFTVFDSGGAVTIKKVIPAVDVLAHATAIVAAATQFRIKSEDLMKRLSTKLGLPLHAFFSLEYKPLLRRGWFRNEWSGKLDRAWRYGFHGYECRFKDRYTGQTLDVCLGFNNEFGVLDPYFFHNFVVTTPGFEVVSSLFKNHFDDPLRALTILGLHGHLVLITDPSTGRRGFAAPRP